MVPDTRSHPHPSVMMDFAFNKANSDDKDDGEYGTTLVLVDRDTGFTAASVTGSTEAESHAARVVINFGKKFGHKTMELRSDNEPSLLALQQRVQTTRHERTILSNGKLKDSPSMGMIESVIRWWRGKVKIFRF